MAQGKPIASKRIASKVNTAKCLDLQIFEECMPTWVGLSGKEFESFK